MASGIHTKISFSKGTFSLIIAPSTIISEALTLQITGHSGRTLYLCGNYPEILPNLTKVANRFSVRRALTAYQVLSILEESDESLTLFEHDRSLYDDAPDILDLIGEQCRQRAAETGKVILFAQKPDIRLNLFQKYADRIVHCIPRTEKSGKTRKKSSSQQMLLNRF